MSAPVRAPEIALPGLAWFNTPSPLSLSDLRGRFVILDFWTFCCINCMHILPTLRKLEQRFPEEVVVIGVHSPKFAAEREPANVARAISRYDVEHPVVHDPEFRIWQAYAVRAWPTLVFLGPDGYVIGMHSGEPAPDRLIGYVAGLIEQARSGGLLRPRPLELGPAAKPEGRLLFPGKMKPIGETGLYAVADAGHHQIVELDAGGREIGRHGCGLAGFADGPAGEVRFRDPQGLDATDDIILVADTGNHAIRVIDRRDGSVSTLAGRGQRGPVLGFEPRPARTVALASPWDIEIGADAVYFANAGTHQLGVVDIDAGSVAALAGDGGEAIEDGPAEQARLAQPSGLALAADLGLLFFADAETSAVRMLNLASREVGTLAGTGLFDFGHVNGPLSEARLQHPLGLSLAGDAILIADSYNAAIRLLDLSAGELRDFDDGRFLCEDDLCIPAAEPAGIHAEPDQVFLVDTNNHRILRYDLTTRRYRTWFA